MPQAKVKGQAQIIGPTDYVETLKRGAPQSSGRRRYFPKHYQTFAHKFTEFPHLTDRTHMKRWIDGKSMNHPIFFVS